MHARRISILASALSDDAREAAAMSRQMKLGGLLFDAWSRALDIPALSNTGMREFRHVLGTQDQTLVGLRAAIGPERIGRDADVDRLVSRFDAMLRAASSLSAQVVCLDLGALPEPPPVKAIRKHISPSQAGLILLPENDVAPNPMEDVEPASPTDATELARVNEAMMALGSVADRYSVPVALSVSLSSHASLASALQAAACPWFGVDLDTIAAFRDGWSPDETFTRIGSLVRHVRVRDAVLGSGGRSRPALSGEGSVKFPALLAALEATDYRGWFTIDPFELADRSAAIEAARTALAI